jgi:uncharacterized protein (TIGR02145 family)
MVLRFFLLAVSFLFISCADFERDNPEDQRSNKYGTSQLQSSPSSNSTPGTSSVGGGTSSSSSSKPSSSSVASSVPSSSSAPVQSEIKEGTPVTYEKETYNTVVIGTQTWMARNLNYAATGSKCYGEGVEGVSADSVAKNCATYGRLYDWATAMGIEAKYNSEKWDGSDVKHKGICPSGWHIPGNDDWNVLMKTVNPSCSDNSSCKDAGTKLKATSGWNSNGKGTDDFGFSALPGGYGNSDGSFSSVGNYGRWWSASEYYSGDAYGRGMDYDIEGVTYYYDFKSYLCSVRCLQD